MARAKPQNERNVEKKERIKDKEIKVEKKKEAKTKEISFEDQKRHVLAKLKKAANRDWDVVAKNKITKLDRYSFLFKLCNIPPTKEFSLHFSERMLYVKTATHEGWVWFSDIRENEKNRLLGLVGNNVPIERKYEN